MSLPGPTDNPIHVDSVVRDQPADKAYLAFEEEAQAVIRQWTEYANTFEIHSPVRELYLELVDSLEEEFEAIENQFEKQQSLVEISELIDNSRKRIGELVEPHLKLKEALDPLKKRVEELARLFKQLAQDFPQKSPRHQTFLDRNNEIFEIFSDLEKDIAKNPLEENKFAEDIERANAELSDLVKDDINFVIARKTPLERIEDRLKKAIDPEQMKKLEISRLRLQTEGAEKKAPSSGFWSRVSPKNMLKTAGYYFAVHRRLAELIHGTYQIVSKHLAKPQAITSLPKAASTAEATTTSLSGETPKAPLLHNFGKPRPILAVPSLRAALENPAHQRPTLKAQ